MSDERLQWIAARAYALWEQEGQPAGRDHEHWVQANREREHLEITRASHDGNDVIARNIAMQQATRNTLVASGAAVLVVDDEPNIRLDAVDALQNAGFKAFEAENADQALSVLQDNRIGTLYTDVMMPGSMDGLGLASKVRALWPKTQIIVASGMVRLARNELSRGMHFIPKPVPLQLLVELMRRPYLKATRSSP